MREALREQSERWLDLRFTLQQRADRFRHAYDHAAAALLTVDRIWVIRRANQEARRLLGDNKAPVLGKPLLVFVDPTDAPPFFRHVRQAQQTGRSTTTVRLRTGRVVLVNSRSAASPDHGGPGFETALSNADEPWHGQNLLREREQRYRDIVEAVNEGICVVDARNVVTFANQRFGAMVGIAAEHLPGIPAARFHLDADPHTTLAEAAVVMAEHGARSDVRLRRGDGETFWASVSTAVLRNPGGALAGAVRLYADITAQKQLSASRDGLVRRLVNAQEDERRRIARELHDQMGQHIMGVSLGLTRLASLAQSSAEMSAIVTRLRALADLMARDVHHLALELRPASLDDLGLPEALTNYAQEIGRRFDLRVDVHCDRCPRLAPVAETTVYRIAQEAVTNAVKHANASSLSLILERRPSQLQLIVEDDGRGFNARRVLRFGPPSARLGIGGMIERAALIGAELHIESRPGAGTSLFLRIPLPERGTDSHEEAQTAAG